VTVGRGDAESLFDQQLSKVKPSFSLHPAPCHLPPAPCTLPIYSLFPVPELRITFVQACRRLYYELRITNYELRITNYEFYNFYATCQTGTKFPAAFAEFEEFLTSVIKYSCGTGQLLLPLFRPLHKIVLIVLG
jgi:hypothetical protein